MVSKSRFAILALTAIMGFRMLGLFTILPVFALYANKLPGATSTLIGVALGVYGLTQACLQIPFGMLSDRVGRKKVISVGLLLFIIGSLVAGLSHSITGIIIGRTLQGSGAVGSTILATIADLTIDEDRSKAMALVGLGIGLSFMVAMVIGPIINAWFHLSGIFWTTMGLAIISFILLHTVVPTPSKLLAHPDLQSQIGRFKSVLNNTQLLRLNAGIFLLHAILTAMFIAVPIVLTQLLSLTAIQQIGLYLLVLVLSFLFMLPVIIVSEKKRCIKPVFITAIAAVLLSQLLFFVLFSSVGHRSEKAASGIIVLILFFTAFTLLEAILPSLVSKISPISNKGTAMGVYSASQFLGIFLGGTIGGVIFSHFQTAGVFIFCTCLGLLWFMLAVSMREPPYLSTMIFRVGESKRDTMQLQASLLTFPGVVEAMVSEGECLIYVKIDRKRIDQDDLKKKLQL